MAPLSFIHRNPDRNPKRYTFPRVLWRGFLRRCPQCGKGHLFEGYLKVVENCPHCREPLGHIRSDDAAPWTTIMVAGHILLSLYVWLEFSWELSLVTITTIMCVAALLSVLIMLPFIKGALVGIMWRLGLSGSEDHT